MQNGEPTEPLDEETPGSVEHSWHELKAGTVLAERYRIERLISRGGMGAVFEATQLGLNRSVAVKLLLPVFNRDERIRERFRREARSVASLRHPHIVQIYDFGLSDYGPYIVMEIVRGRSLRKLLKDGQIALERVVEVFTQVCSAVASAHAAGILHRDLKPDNILIEELPDGAWQTKVLDFGISKLIDEGQQETEANLTGANIIGSPAYMSPEQSLGLELDERSDVYSLGIVLYEMLTGQTPFGGRSSRGILAQQVNAAPRPVQELRPDVSPALESVVSRALEKDRNRRYDSVVDLASDLRQAWEDPEYDVTKFTSQFGLRSDPFQTNIDEPISPGNSRESGGSSTLMRRRRLAILPLRNLTGDPEIEFLGYALADSVITQLSHLKGLIVRPSAAVERYRREAVDARQAGRELQVETILWGSYLQAGDQIRVNVQLVDVARNEILWQEQISMRFDNVIELQDHICEKLIGGLRLKLSTGEQEALKRDGPRHPLAYEFYLRGIGLGRTSSELKQAIGLLEQAIALDADYATAWAALAERYINVHTHLHDSTLLDRAKEAAQRALAINPKLPAAIFWLAVYHAEIGEVTQGLALCKRLLEVAPNSEYAYQAMGHAYDYAGLPDVALMLFRRANEINPLNYPYMIGFILYQKGEYAEARREFETRYELALEMRYWLAVIDHLEGHQAEAIKRLEEAIERDREGMVGRAGAALLAAFRGERERGLQILGEMITAGGNRGAYNYYLPAQIYAQLGDLDSSIQMLRKAVEAGYANYPFITTDPLLDPARQHPAFAEIAEAARQLQSKLQLMLVTG